MDEKRIKIFKALGDKTRIQIVEYLLFEDQCACDFVQCVGKDQSTVSRHLKILVESQILISEKKGRNLIYKIKDKNMKEILKSFGLKPSNACCIGGQKK